MQNGWRFTPGRVAFLYTTGVLLGASLTAAFFGSTGNYLTALAMMLSGWVVLRSCRPPRGPGVGVQR